MISIFTAFLAFLAPAASWACSPYPAGKAPTIPEHYKNAEAVFVGSVVPHSQKTEGKEPTVELKVLKSWKGDAKGKVRYAQNRHGTCGFRLVEGATYLLFASKRDGLFDASGLQGSSDIQHAVPILRLLLEMEKNGGKISDHFDASPAPGAAPTIDKLTGCEKKKNERDSCYGDILACSYVWDAPKKEACYKKARNLLGKALKADWLD